MVQNHSSSQRNIKLNLGTVLATVAVVATGAAVVNWIIPNLIARQKPRSVSIPKGTRLTFDDGPSQVTEEVLDILKRENIRAAFFVVGEEALARPEIIKRMAREGHEIGLHAHRHGIPLWPWQRWADLSHAYKTLDALNIAPRFYRAPHGIYDAAAIVFCMTHGMTILHWHSLVNDWEPIDDTQLLNKLMSAASQGKGRVIVLHDGCKGNADYNAHLRIPRVLQRFIAAEKTRGARFQDACSQ